MRNLIEFIIRFGYVGLFLVLELIAFNLIINFNQSQKEIWINSTHLYTGKIQSKIDYAANFIQLQTQLDSIQAENAELIEQIVNYKLFDKGTNYQSFIDKDSMPYQFIPGKVVSRVKHLSNNFATINKGKFHGVRKGMGVISFHGVFGIVTDATDHFSRVLTVLNIQSPVSVRLKDKSFFGLCFWEGYKENIMRISSIPKYVEIQEGDTIETSGYSTIFPPSILVGTIKSFYIEPGGSNHIIDVELFENPNTTEYVYLVDMEHVSELDSLHNLKQE